MTATPDASGWPAGIRPARPDDATPILAAMLVALERGDYEGIDRHYLEESAARIASEPVIAAVAEDAGRLAGWIAPLHFDLTVDPAYRRRGHATRLLAAGRSLARAADLPELLLWVPRRPGAVAFARATGAREHSSLWQLCLAPGVPVEPAVFPGDLRVRPIDPGPDDEPFVALVNETFVDHPTPFRLDLAQLRRTHGRPDFDPGTILLVVEAGDPGRMMGFCRITRYEDDDGRPIGEVKHVGVRREHRGHGLGRALVRWGAAEVRRRGAGDVLLSVEGANDGALRLYESLGFKRGVEWRRWTWPPEGGSLGR